MPNSTARRLTTGSTPGIPWQTGHVWLFGGAPKVVGQPQSIFDRVRSCAWTSRPMTVSIVAEAAWSVLTVGGLPEVRCGSAGGLPEVRCGSAGGLPEVRCGSVGGLPGARRGFVRSRRARSPRTPRRRLLVRVRSAQDAGLIERLANELETDREPLGAEPTRHRDCGEPRHVRRD